MNYSKYEILLKAVELKSITKAARELGYTQTGLSYMIQTIEKDFGFPILTRTRSGIAWNPAGEKLAPYLQALAEGEQQLRQKIEDLSTISSGSVRIGVFRSFASYVLPAFLSHLSEIEPELEVEVRIGEYTELESLLLDGEIDMAFTINPSDKRFDTTLIMKDEIQAVLPQGHPLLIHPRISIAQMIEYPYILFGRKGMRDMAHLADFEKLEAVTKYTVEEDATTLSMVENGLGLSTLARLISSQYTNNVEYRSMDPPAYRDIMLAVIHGAALSPQAKRFFNAFLDYRIPIKFND